MHANMFTYPQLEQFVNFEHSAQIISNAEVLDYCPFEKCFFSYQQRFMAHCLCQNNCYGNTNMLHPINIRNIDNYVHI